jgi:beta-galactosidase
MLRTSGVQPAFGTLPEGVEVSRREGNGKEVFIVVNHTKDAKSVALPHPRRPVLAGGEAVNKIELPPRGVEALR